MRRGKSDLWKPNAIPGERQLDFLLHSGPREPQLTKISVLEQKMIMEKISYERHVVGKQLEPILSCI